jgi:hypothetical protein
MPRLGTALRRPRTQAAAAFAQPFGLNPEDHAAVTAAARGTLRSPARRLRFTGWQGSGHGPARQRCLALIRDVTHLTLKSPERLLKPLALDRQPLRGSLSMQGTGYHGRAAEHDR